MGSPTELVGAKGHFHFLQLALPLIFRNNQTSSDEQDCAGEEHPAKPEEHQVKSWLHDEHQLQAGWGAGEDSEQSGSQSKAEDKVRKQRGYLVAASWKSK